MIHPLDNFPIETIRPNYLWGFESLSLLAACSRLSDSRGWRVSERHVKIRRVIWERESFGGGFSARFIFVFEFSQFRGPDCLKAWNRLCLSLLQAGLTRNNIFACGTCSNPGLRSRPEFSRRNQESRQRYSNLPNPSSTEKEGPLFRSRLFKRWITLSTG